MKNTLPGTHPDRSIELPDAYTTPTARRAVRKSFASIQPSAIPLRLMSVNNTSTRSPARHMASACSALAAS
jgi:hypothetical protein